MVTNYPERLTAEPVRSAREPALGRLVSQALRTLSQFFCALRGHDAVLHFGENRMSLRCTSCGYDSPGWEIGGRRPRVRFEGDARRHLLQRRAAAVLVARKTA